MGKMLLLEKPPKRWKPERMLKRKGSSDKREKLPPLRLLESNRKRKKPLDLKLSKKPLPKGRKLKKQQLRQRDRLRGKLRLEERNRKKPRQEERPKNRLPLLEKLLR